jgi:hypothetical protein
MQAFLQASPGMAVAPAAGGATIFSGAFSFEALWDGVEVKDSYELRIEVAPYPEALPKVFETGGRIPRKLDEHVFESSGQLCLGSALRLRQMLGQKLNLLTFADECIVPFLYAATRRKTEGCFVLGELSHGNAGLYEDYQAILGVKGEDAVRAALRILATKSSAAERHPCPCGCGKRLILCEFRHRIAEFRQLAPRKVFQNMDRALRDTTLGAKT